MLVQCAGGKKKKGNRRMDDDDADEKVNALLVQNIKGRFLECF